MLKYSINEKVSSPVEIKHNVFRVLLQNYKIQGIDIAVSSDIAAGTGLGSSSAFTVGVIQLVENYLGRNPSKFDLAVNACKIELDDLGEPIGIQDQHASAYGGINIFNFNSRSDVSVSHIDVEEKMLEIIESNLLLIRVPGNRSASKLLKKQIENIEAEKQIDTLNQMKLLVDDGLQAWRSSAADLGEILDKTWKLKKELSSEISNSKVDELYEDLLESGFYGGKLLGAGASGYLLMVGSKNLVKTTISSGDYSTLQVKLDEYGSKVIYTS
jgi:D-glycero-alpha-D-manno-heptose-7-phosphate kinase